MSFAAPNRRLYVGRIPQDASRLDVVRCVAPLAAPLRYAQQAAKGTDDSIHVILSLSLFRPPSFDANDPCRRSLVFLESCMCSARPSAHMTIVHDSAWITRSCGLE